ncbi:PH domain-containing protein [Sediminibacillus halophilus]|uniref:PH domain-containing protein n=1 Tax=Sediminibacillus halophilus TaxID=482461 RepID=A0A1G9RT72_9BACI|nr:PH domain-containing protein [Sediminibacillus halophilus]SDM26469.1 PH domain-containing protein [Sediminibacillus halophilus]
MNMFDSIKDTIENAGFGRKGIMKRYINTFSDNNLEKDEKLLGVAAPSDKPTKLLFVTDKKMCFYHMAASDQSNDLKVQNEEVTSCDVNSNNGLAELTITTTKGNITINKVPEQTADQIKDIIEKISQK